MSDQVKVEVKQNKQAKPKVKRRRGRPEKPLKIDDTPRNIARSLFGLPPLKSE